MKNIFAKKGNKLSLDVHFGHDALAYMYDIAYIPRMMRKIAFSLSFHRFDIDRVQADIEAFLILNSRYYEDLIIDLVKNVRRYQQLPKDFSIKPTIKAHRTSLSYRYHEDAPNRRHRVAHGSNFNVVGIKQFKNQTLPKPMNFIPKFKPPLFNMAHRGYFVRAWRSDILECAKDIESLTEEIYKTINQHKSLPATDILTSGSVMRPGKTSEDFFEELKKMDAAYARSKPMSRMKPGEIATLQREHIKRLEELHDEYYES